MPERQRGVEFGADVFFANAAYVKATWYDQYAIDLIQQVRLRPSETTLTYQFQNVGAVRNRGVELEAGYHWRHWSATAIAYVPRSTVERVARNYTGELLPGDQLLEVPDAAGVASLRYDTGRFHAEAGTSWIGSWIGYNVKYITQVELGLAPQRGRERDYWISYPGVTRPFAAFSVDVAGDYRVFVRADNPGHSAKLIRDNLSPPLGHTLMAGVQRRN